MRVEHVEHARDGPVVNSLVGVYRLRIVLLDDAVNLSELTKTVAEVGVRGGPQCSPVTLGSRTQKTTNHNDEKNEEERTTCTTRHESSLTAELCARLREYR